MSLRAVVFAYHSIGVAGLESLVRHGFDIAGVCSHQDDPAENVWFESVSDWCRDRGVEVSCPPDPNTAEEVERIRSLAPDIIFSFYYRLMLGPEILGVPRLGCLNLHGSLLPKYRGRAPVNWAILNGETETGVTLHYMVEKPDAGDIVGRRKVEIGFEDTAADVYGKLVIAARDLMDELLPLIEAGKTPRIPNPLEEGSCFGGRRPEDGKIDWGRDAVSIHNLVRAVTRPYPGAFGTLAGDKLIIWRARPLPDVKDLDPGRIALREGEVLAGAGEGAIKIMEVNWRGRELSGDELIKELGGLEGEVIE